ncbi:hypothetical protein Fmac_014842 [Flemingia macrophylla]|uniref:Dof zinc finger protein n=1 Tax=Flemingia macrophylla TaxID=520843 RepID=A0ABD1MCY0_9FABA
MSLFPPQIFFLTLSLSSLSHKTPFTHPPPTKTLTHHFVTHLLHYTTLHHSTKIKIKTFSHSTTTHQMPSSNSGESRRATKAQTSAGAPPPPEQENLPCPRCDSTNTKFCYYNNYNYSQPRHFCKSCRRYWTHGGTLRDIPVGGGSRKNAKRSRTHHAATSSSSSTMTSAPEHALPALAPIAAGVQGGSMTSMFGVDGDVKPSNVGGGGCGSFTSLLNNTQGSGFLALGGFGLGLGHGFEDVGFGIGRSSGWAFPAMVDGGNIGGGGVVGSGVNVNAWQLEGGDGGFVGGDCFSWPGLAISTPGNGLK